MNKVRARVYIYYIKSDCQILTNGTFSRYCVNCHFLTNLQLWPLFVLNVQLAQIKTPENGQKRPILRFSARDGTGDSPTPDAWCIRFSPEKKIFREKKILILLRVVFTGQFVIIWQVVFRKSCPEIWRIVFGVIILRCHTIWLACQCVLFCLFCFHFGMNLRFAIFLICCVCAIVLIVLYDGFKL